MISKVRHDERLQWAKESQRQGPNRAIISSVWTRWGDSFCRCNQMADAPLLQNLPVESKSQRLSDKLSHIICYNKQTSLLNYIVPFGILKESLASDIFQIFHNKQTKWFRYSSLREDILQYKSTVCVKVQHCSLTFDIFLLKTLTTLILAFLCV